MYACMETSVYILTEIIHTISYLKFLMLLSYFFGKIYEVIDVYPHKFFPSKHQVFEQMQEVFPMK